jgi:hypothetical protein
VFDSDFGYEYKVCFRLLPRGKFDEAFLSRGVICGAGEATCEGSADDERNDDATTKRIVDDRIRNHFSLFK